MPLFSSSRLSNSGISGDLISEANQGIVKLRARLVEEITTSAIPDWHIRSQTKVFFQCHIRRCLMFIEGGHEAYLSGRGLISSMCARAIYETVACVMDFCDKLHEHLNENNFEKTAGFIHVRLFATRSKDLLESTNEFDYNAPNVLTQIDRFSKQFPGVRDYDQLCEILHPNSLGALLHFSDGEELDEYTYVTRFSNDLNARSSIESLVLAGALLTLMDKGISVTERRLDEHSFHPTARSQPSSSSR
jgi:hypothetical protein